MQEPINNQSMLKVGTVLRGIYRIDSYLSSGGFGNTYVATNIEFDERVAVKEFFMKGVTQRDGNQTTVSVSNMENQESFLQQREKFKKEARRLRQLNNPHIVRVHDLFEENGTAYYVMDYVDGENLSDRLKRTGRPMTESEVNQILPQILDALKSVHDADIWHLDLKPANIMIDKSGQVKLIDFGASKQLNAQKGGATTSTAISYTNGYAPREQMEQNYDKFGPWTDIYALGATLYNLLTNKRPPLPTDIDDDISDDKHLTLPMPDVSDAMKNLILRMMNTNKAERPQSVAAVIEKRRMPYDDTLSDDEETIIASFYSNEENEIDENLLVEVEDVNIDEMFYYLPLGIRLIITIIAAGVAGLFWDIVYMFLTRNDFSDKHPTIFGFGMFCILCVGILWIKYSANYLTYIWFKNVATATEIIKLNKMKTRIDTSPWWVSSIAACTYLVLIVVVWKLLLPLIDMSPQSGTVFMLEFGILLSPMQSYNYLITEIWYKIHNNEK